MKKTVPFTKEITFQTKIFEITDIEITHNLEPTEFNTIEGSFEVKGKYKLSDMSPIENDFENILPFTIEVDDKYDISNVKIKINDFYFEIINEDILKVNIELELSDVLEKIKQEEEEELLARCYDDEDTKEEVITLEEDIIEPIDILDKTLEIELESTKKSIVSKEQQTTNKPITEIFPTLNETEDTFKSYYVYIVRENDTLDDILNKYKVTKESLLEYNTLEEIKIGTKLIIPCSALKDE